MKKKILCIFTIILTILAGCAKEEKSNIEVSDDEVGIEIMEGMNYLVAGNDYGFYFDIMPVYDEYMEIVEIYSKYRVILENGMVDPQEGLEAMNQELDACHIDEVIAEKQRQFDRWKGK